MSIFRNHKTSADRSATDRNRHKKKIKRAIRDGVHNIVSDESIIGQDGKKKIRIPVRGIKEYKFIFGNNEKNNHDIFTQFEDLGIEIIFFDEIVYSKSQNKYYELNLEQLLKN